MSDVVYRVQDAEGRGPFKPGFSMTWVLHRADHNNLPPCFVEFGRVDQNCLVGEHVGCACRTLEQLRRWFTQEEFSCLLRHGYNAVRVTGRVLAESGVQLVVACPRPLSQHDGIVDLYADADQPAEASQGGAA